ncbi:phosphoglycerate mutase family protein [Pseudovibrio sp. POLY-S9]|uniref:phosphoglycerate mutase family protein n=1 Tax=Pseudovibrio sp. POLY-S9 TaxID=1576596 RepID=UPI00070BDEEF|nr:phosphoglycerate mutase family protein [Pseudovibrio sp. POLY-S9]
MLNELILLRHGESEHMLKGVVGGWTNSTLTPRGITQAKQTTKWITEKTGNEFTKVRQLRELNNGVAKDLSKAWLIT